MPHPFDAAGYVDDAVGALAHSNVYVSPEVGGSTQLAHALEQQVGDASIGVVVFSTNVELEASDAQILAELAESTPYETIVVAVGDDLFAGSRALPAGEAMRIANEAEQSAGSLDEALSQTVQQITAATAGAGDGGGGDGGLAIGLGVGVAVIVALAAATLTTVLALRRRTRQRPLPDPVRSSIARLRALVGEYSGAAARGTQQAGEFAGEISGIVTNTTELFVRLGRRGDEAQRAMAAVEYGDTLRKLAAALDRDYLLDILTHPNLWDDPAERVREVRDSVTAVQTEIVDNIRQVNARRGLLFQVSLDGMIGRRKELREWEREFDRAADDDPVARDG
ncbi:hypothetical protein AB1K54_15775 [Microbacterium sp. BWT-B31]|uniref:hypothetical protein n=1 Tax=Microbacterium sp. BWT-B31 TaxID=3232072 RepID=UPI003526D9D3